jgi:SAM-dependent methyltransferase
LDVNPPEFNFAHPGQCPACEQQTVFTANGPYFRATLKCEKCSSRPRQRALMHVLKLYFPKWRELSIHESSPGWDVVSVRLANECNQYAASQFDTSHDWGYMVENSNLPCKRYRCENLEKQTFSDGSFDIVVTQDVFEHVFRPDLAISEIARTLKPGGATIMTVPIVRRRRNSLRRASLENGGIVHILPAEYHGNPLSKDGALVTIDWGFDICAYFQHHSGLSFLMLQIDNIDLGIRAELNEVLIGFKGPIPEL